MYLDIALPVLQAVVSVLMALVGIEMANNPPATARKKNQYRAVFAFSAALLCGLTYVQSKRTITQQAGSQKEAHDAELKSQTDIGYMKGQLNGLSMLMGKLGERTTDPAMTAFAASVKKLAENVGKQAPSEPMSAIPKPPPGPPPPLPVPESTKAANLKLNKCDVNGDGKVDVEDVQMAVNQSLGINPTPAGDINGDGMHTVLDIQAVVNASLGGGCPY